MANYKALVPNLQRVEPLSGTFTLSAATRILIHDPGSASRERQAAAELRGTLRRLTGLAVEVASWTTAPLANSIVLGRMEAPAAYRAAFLPIAQRKGVTDATFAPSGVFAPSAAHAEDHLIDNTPTDGFLLLAGRTEKGVFLGAQTLIQFCEQLLTPAQLGLDRAKIYDYPRLALRATSMGVAPGQGLPVDTEMRERLRYFAALKLNAVVIAADWFSAEQVGQVKELFDLCRFHGLEPIPAAGYYGSSLALLEKEPRVFEGNSRSAPFQFPDSDGDLAALLLDPQKAADLRFVIQSAAALELIDSGTKEAYQYGRDYTLTPNDLKFAWREGVSEFTANPDPPRLVRTSTGRLGKGRRVILRYTSARAVPGPRNPYCPYEPLVAGTLRPVYERIIRTLRPEMIHLGCDEVTRTSRCTRCSGQLPAVVMAKAVTDLFNLASELDPNIKCLFWADRLNPFDSALLDPTSSVPHATWEALKKIPRSPRLVLVPWAYEEGYRPIAGPGWPAGAEPNLVNFIKATYVLFDDVEGYSFQTIGAVAPERPQAVHWWARASQGTSNALGLLHTTWSGAFFPLGHDGTPQYNGLVALAAFAWKGAATPNLAGEDWLPYQRLHSPYYGAAWTLRAAAAQEFAEINFRYGEYLKPWTDFVFQYALNSLGWTAIRDVKTFSVPPGNTLPLLFVHVVGTNPALASPDWLRVPAAEYGVIEISMQVGHGGQGRVLFTTEDQSDFSETQGVSFPLQPGPEAKVYRLDMRRVPAWRGTIRRLRLDPFAVLQPVDVGIFVRWVKLLRG